MPRSKELYEAGNVTAVNSCEAAGAQKSGKLAPGLALLRQPDETLALLRFIAKIGDEADGDASPI